MNLLHSGFLIVLFTILEAINGLTPDTSKTNSSKDLPTVHAVTTEKSQQENGVSESVKIIVPVAPQVATNATATAAGAGNNTATMTAAAAAAASTTETPPTTKSTPALTPAPTPAPTPTLVSFSKNDTWVVRDNTTKKICIIAEMVMQLNITYPAKSGSLLYEILNITKNSTASGNCSKDLQSMVISWGPGHSLKFTFSANQTTKKFYVSGLDLSINATVLKDANVENNQTMWRFQNKTAEFFTPLDMSYKCSKVQDLNLEGVDEKAKAVLSMKDTQLEAYMNKTTAGFEAAQNCETFDTPDIVPIAVGCALAVLVFAVLVAYLIGRKRSQNRGYLSM